MPALNVSDHFRGGKTRVKSGLVLETMARIIQIEITENIKFSAVIFNFNIPNK